MDIRDIRYFLKVSEHGHLGKAAEELHISQPALSKCIQRLEAIYDVHLFERAGRGIALTEAGHLLRERYQLLEQDLLDIRREVSSYSSGIAGTVRIGCSGSIASFFLPSVCRAMQERAPDLKVLIRVGMDDALEDALRAGAIDVIIVPDRKEISDGLIVSAPLLSDTVVVVAREGHPLAGRTSTLSELLQFGWVLPTPTVSIRQWLEKVFADKGLPAPQPTVTAAPLVPAPYILAETDLLSFMSRRNLTARRPLVELVNEQTTMHRQFVISHRARSFVSPAVRYFVTLLQQEARDL
ncbi:LysR family transcriptional regulator [Agrobacterium sp. Ap1]|jgi:DNA-binding transcriptional LysR family regulator|uniref:LysR family transcriptional regulator n=1 Tax=Rhizobium/Agrobacterium group TaxID=227290 RepID=UPI00161DFF75|nr:LysR family transcriptional regulator [Agrobacterium sp. Ap1]MBO0144711.1 LysR family transcriptional regulator [Agrobacterium sp. Ap1]